MSYFTHEAVALEDTTIARHLVRVGQLVSRDDMYRTPEEIREILQQRATRDRETDRPLLCCSSDAHALRRFVDDTWAAKWKMATGLRLWCEDNKTGQILPLFSDVVVILDVYHLLQAFAAFGALCFKPKAKQARRRWLNRAAALTVGRRYRRRKLAPRRGHRKRAAKATAHAHERRVDPDTDPVKQATELVAMLYEVPTPTDEAEAAQARFFRFLYGDPDRINYVAFRARGYRIGSGAMESLHRTSQLRLKLSGAEWLPHTSQAIFNIRMMRLAENSSRFWDQPDLEQRLAAVELPN